jgi:hypothetical protein
LAERKRTRRTTLRDENRVQRGNGFRDSGREFIPQGRLFIGNVHGLDRTYDGRIKTG